MEVETKGLETTPITHYFQQYHSLANGLLKLNIAHPTYLQADILSINSQIDNIVIAAPPGSGKRLAGLLYALKKFVNIESGTLLLLTHSKEPSFLANYILTSLTKLPTYNFYMSHNLPEEMPAKNCIICSPLQAESLMKPIKDAVQVAIVLEIDYHVSFGYYDHIARLFGTLPKECIYVLTSCTIFPELTDLKEKYLKKTLNVTVEDETVKEQQGNKIEGQINHFYTVGEPIFKNIALYMILKFGLVNPKVLVVCKDMREVYRTHLFLQRCSLHGVGLYNHENPVNVKFYGLSLWLSGNVSVLLCTTDFFDDIKKGVFRENCKAHYKRPDIQLKNLSTIITLNLAHLRSSNTDYRQDLYKHFYNKALIINLLDNDETEREQLQELIEMEKQQYETVRVKDFPITRTEMEAFKYRINDVYHTCSPKKVEWYMMYDLKRKILKSKDLQTHFAERPEEKELLLKKVNELKSKLDYGKVELGYDVPEYLIPQFLKSAYLEKMKVEQKKEQKDLQESKKLGKKESVQNKIKRAVANIDPEEQDPEVTDVSRLKLISSRKRWKLQHGFKLKKRNIRNEKKGIFETS